VSQNERCSSANAHERSWERRDKGKSCQTRRSQAWVVPTAVALVLGGCGSGAAGKGEAAYANSPSVDDNDASVDGGSVGGALDAGARPSAPVCDKGAYEGSYQISGEEAREQLAELSGYTAVTQSLHITDTTNLETLAGLECLEKVGRTLRIARNRELRSLDALERLDSAEKIHVIGNPALDECHAFAWAARQGLTDQQCAAASGAQREPPAVEGGTATGPDPFARLVETLEEPRPPYEDRVLARALPGVIKRTYLSMLKGDDGDDEGYHDDFEIIGAYLDAPRSRYLVLIHYDLDDNFLVLLDAEGRYLGRGEVKGRGVELGLLDVVGDETAEVFVSVIEGRGMSVYPVSWHLFELAGKRLRRIGRIAKNHSTPQYDKRCKGEGAGTETRLYSFVNEVSFPARDRMVVETVVYADDSFEGLAPPKGFPRGLGEVSEYTYRPAQGKLVRTGFKRGKTYDELQAETAAAEEAEADVKRDVVFRFEASAPDPCGDPLGPDFVL
jgi:hypothetical protein